MRRVLRHDNVTYLTLDDTKPVVQRRTRVHGEVVQKHLEEGDEGRGRVGDVVCLTCIASEQCDLHISKHNLDT